MQRVNSTGFWVRKGLSSHVKTVDKLLKLRADDASFVLNAGVKPVHLSRVKPATAHRITERARAFGVTPWWMTFPHSTDKMVAEYLDDCARMLDGASAAQRPEGLELDAENKHDSIGWGPSGTRLAPTIVEGIVALGFDKLYVTCVVFRSGFRRQDRALLDAAKDAGLWVGLAPQGYSKEDPSKTWDDGELFRPGVMQNFIMDHCGELAEQGVIDELRMGGMTAFQDHPDPWPDDREALELAHDTAYARGCRAWRYWALGQVGTRDGDAAFLQDAPTRTAVKGHTFDPDEADNAFGESPSRKSQVKEAQRQLADLGYKVGDIDGLIGPRTKAAASAYRSALDFIPACWDDGGLLDNLDALGL